MDLERKVNKLEDRVRELENENKKLAVELKNIELETVKGILQIMPKVYKALEQFQENTLEAVADVIAKKMK